MKFDYDIEKIAIKELEVEDIGNVSLRCTNDLDECYVLVIKTSLGISFVMQYGPYVPDLNTLPKNVDCNFSRFDFNEVRIKKTISQFINNPKSKIKDIEIVDSEEILDECVNICEYMKNENVR